MMMPMESYVRRGKRMVRKAVSQPRLRSWAEKTGYFLCGLLLSAASLGNSALPLPLALLCAGITGVPGMLVAAGGCLGYWIFWDGVGGQGPAWMALGLVLSTLLGGKKLTRHMPLLMPALAALTVALTGLFFQAWWRDNTTVWMYLLRIGMAFGSTWIFAEALQQKDPMAQWGAGALGVLALAQIAPVPFLNFGFLVAGAAAVLMPFPAVVSVWPQWVAPLLTSTIARRATVLLTH
jgi:hypothetical protein